MNLNSNKFSPDRICVILFALISAALVWVYRGNPGDIGIISEAGQKILNRVDPYVESEFANSPVTAVITHLVARIVPSAIFLTVIQLLNIIGLVIFSKYVRSYFGQPDKSGLILFLVSLTISYRALIANVQLTGILLALFVLSLKLISKPRSLHKLLGYSVILLAFELKPQIILPLLLLVFLRNRDYWLKLIAAISTLGIHVVLNIYFGSILEILWIKKISAFSDKSFLEGPEISLWKAIVHYSDAPAFTELISTVVLILYYSVLILLIFRNPRHALIVGLAAPFIGSYAHMYDLLGLFIVFLTLNTKSTPTNIPIILLIVIPFNTHPVVVIIISFLTMLFLQFANRNKIYSLRNSAAVWTLASILVLLATSSLAAGNQELSLSIRLAILIFGFGFLKLFKKQVS